MECNDEKFMINKEEGFTGGGFFDIDEAVEKITYSQDKSLVRLSYKKYLKLKEFPIGDIEKEEMLV
jgi:hypothetical protein